MASDNPYIGLRLSTEQTYGIPLFGKELARGLSMLDFTQPSVKKTPRTIKRDVDIDSTGSEVTVEEQAFDVYLHQPATYSLSDYTRYCLDKNLDVIWQNYKVKDISGERIERKRGKGIEIAIPVKIRSRAFQTIFGGDQVSLSVTGQINIRGGFRHEKRSQVKTAINRGSDYNFKMEQTQRFRVQGNIGDKVTVSVDQDSERPFDFENTVKLDYKGYDDEIIQSIQAGNISLSLPATRFVSFSGKNSGLFGIKAEAQVGNFHLTTIASQEKGENKKLTISGGAEEGEYKIQDYNYMKGVYFFVDHTYRDNYTELDESGTHYFYEDKIITDFEIYKSAPGYEQKEGRIYGWALENPDVENPDTTQIDQENTYGYWIRLDRSEYFLETSLGYIKLRNAVSDNEMLAIAYRDSSGKVVGDTEFNPFEEDVIILRMLKPRSPRPSDSTWDLMFRHVYYLGARDIDPDGFEAKIFFDTPSGDDEETINTDEGVKSYLSLFGLDKVNQSGETQPDNIIDNISNILRLGQGELEFPSLRPFADESYLPKEKIVSAMYDTTNQSYIANESKFYILVKSKNRSATYDLGWNVIEGSEEVILNGSKLIKDKDYIIDYYSGKLTILREEATSPSANVEVNYQRNELFQLEKKTLLGMRGEYRFWENSFIGGTFLYLNQSTLDQKVRVGKGPMRNMIWDVNTSFDFKPNFLTKAIDAFPLIETKEESNLKFEGEIAQILPNPNTLNNTKTDDPDGVAYIDDFEAAKKITPLGVIKSGWRASSCPLGIGEIPDPTNNWQRTFYHYKRRGRLIWYNPYNQVAIREIWPNRDTHNPNTPQVVHVLTLEFSPADRPDDPEYEPTQSWGGIQRWLSTGYSDQSDSKFLEVWVDGDAGRLHIDLGRISEDIIPNGKLDDEDRPVNGIKNELLDPGEDVGLDGMAGADPEDYWDINKNGQRDDGEPISYDDWYYTTGGYDYSRINGTEGNENDPGGRLPDSEDFNGNGSLDVQNDYFEYTFSLSKSHKDTMYIAGGQDNEYGWRLYRIPLSEFTKRVGEPDMSRIEYVRVWIDSCYADTYLRIAEINLVGNDWKEMGVAPDDFSSYNTKNDSTVIAAVTNTHDNDDYSPPPGVSGVKDRITRVEAKEQSLVIRVNELEAGANGILRKTFYQAENYIHYDRMKMFIHGGDAYGRNFSKDVSSVELFLRFGSDNNNYYEYRSPIFEGWEGNNMDIALNDLATLKLQPPDTLTGLRVDSLGNGKYYIIKGEPSLTNVRQLVLGIKNISNPDAMEDYIDKNGLPFSGEIWINELRLSGVKKDKGVALRARAQLKVADVFTINGEINKKDADFHNVNQRFGSGNNEIGGSISGNFSLHKFLPNSWGIAIPINFNYSERTSTPKYLPGSDILVTKDTPDSVLEKIGNENINQGLGVSFRKNTRSNNFFVKNTIDNISISFNTAQSHSKSSTQKYADRETYTANISYNLSFPKDKYFQPFKWIGKAPIISKLAQLKFFYFPTNLNLKASGNRSNSKSETRSGVVTENETFLISRSIQTGIQPFQSMSFDFSRDYKNDLRDTAEPLEEITNFRFGQLTDMSQSISAKFNPQLFRWLKTNFSYSAKFKFSNNLQLKDRGRNASNNNSITTSLTFDPDQFVKSLFKKSSGTRVKRRRPPAKKPPDKSDQDKKEDQGSGFNPLSILGSGVDFITSRIKPINLNLTQRKNISNYGLDPAGGMPSFNYMVGFDKNPGMESVEGVGTNDGSFRDNRSISLQSGLNIIKQMDVSLKYSHDEDENETTTRTGGSSDSWFYIEETGGFPIAEWTVRWSGLEKISFFKKFTQRISFDHNFSGKKQESWQNNPNQKTKTSYTKSFRPLAGFNISLKKNINMNVRYNYSENISFTQRGGSGGQKSVQSDLSFSASYSHSGGMRIPLPFLKNKELKNNMDFQLTISMNNNQSFQKLQEKDWVETDMRKSWSLEPQLNYSFSRNVRGGVHFKMGKNSNKRIGDTTIQELGINVNISISGS